jgi:hypothetical protein
MMSHLLSPLGNGCTLTWLSNYSWSGPVTPFASIREGLRKIRQPHVFVRADVNTDPIPETTSLLGCGHRVGSRPTPPPLRRACTKERSNLAFAERVRQRRLRHGRCTRGTQRRRETCEAESVWYCRRKEAQLQVAQRSTLRLDRARVESAWLRSRCGRGTTSLRPQPRQRPAGGPRPRTEASARGESAANFGPGHGLDPSAIELGHAAVHLGRPRGLGVLVHHPSRRLTAKDAATTPSSPTRLSATMS